MLRNTTIKRPDNALRKLASVMELIYALHEHADKDLFRHWLTLPSSQSSLLEQVSWQLLQASFPGGYCDPAFFEARSNVLAQAHQEAEKSQFEMEAYFKQHAQCEQFRLSFNRFKELWKERNGAMRGVEITESIMQACWLKDLALVSCAQGLKFYIDTKMPNSPLSSMAQVLLKQVQNVHLLQAELSQMINADNREASFRKACSGWYIDRQVKSLKSLVEENKEVESSITSLVPTLKPLRDNWLEYVRSQAQKNVTAEFLLKQYERWQDYLEQNPYYREDVEKTKGPGLFTRENAFATALQYWQDRRFQEALRLLMPGALSRELPCINQLIQWLEEPCPGVVIELLQAKAILVSQEDFVSLLPQVKKLYAERLVKDSQGEGAGQVDLSLQRDLEQQFCLENIKHRWRCTGSTWGEQLLRLAEMQLVLFSESLKVVEQNPTNEYLTTACNLLRECFDNAPGLRDKIRMFCQEHLKVADFNVRIALLSVLEHCGYNGLAQWSDAPVNRTTS